MKEDEEVSSSGLRKIISFILYASVFVCYDNHKKSVLCRRNNSKYIFKAMTAKNNLKVIPVNSHGYVELPGILQLMNVGKTQSYQN